MQEPIETNESQSQSTTQLVYVLMQFALAVRHRIHILLTSLFIVGLLGALYFATATRYYSAKEKLLVLQTGSSVLTDPSVSNEGNRQQLMMPTYVSIITSSKVIESAIRLLRPEDCIDMDGVPREAWGGLIKKRLTASNLFNTNILEIEYRSRDPHAAVAVVNAISTSYLAFMNEKHKGTASEIIEILEKSLIKIERDLDKKELELLTAQQEIGEVRAISDNRTEHPLVSRVIAMNDALVETQKKRVDLEALLASIQYSIDHGENLQPHVMQVASVVGKELLLLSMGISPQDVQTNASIARELLTFESHLITLEKELLPGHQDVIDLRDKIDRYKRYLRESQDRVNQKLSDIQNKQLAPLLTSTIQQQLSETIYREEIYFQRYQQTRTEASQLTGKLARIKILEHRTRGLNDLYDTLTKRIRDLNLKTDGPDIRTDVTDKPVVANRPISPSLKRVVLMVLVVGIGIGLMAVYVVDTLDDRFRSVEELQRHLNASVLAIVRQLKPRTETGVKAVQVHCEPDTVESEAFRTLRTALSLTDMPTQRLVISSSEPGDGKTTVLANLAVSYAQLGKRTLLIDADLRRPGLTAMLEYRRFEGLSTVLQGTEDVKTLALSHILSSGVEGLDVLPSGPRLINPAEHLTSPRFDELLSWAETEYDQIFVDGPPALVASDTIIIGQLVDGVILVVQPEKNQRQTVIRATQGFKTLGINLVGIVINRISDEFSNGYYGHGGYGYTYEYGGNDDEHDAIEEIHLDREITYPIEPIDTHESPTEGIVPRRVA